MSPDGSSLFFRSIPAHLRPDSSTKRALKEFWRSLSRDVAGNREFSCLLTGDKELQRLNREFLGHDYPTDVLSFPQTGDAFIGDLAISIERAAAQATEFGHATLDEIRILMLHGVLHLMGMDHETDGGKMARAERRWGNALGMRRTLVGRTVS